VKERALEKSVIILGTPFKRGNGQMWRLDLTEWSWLVHWHGLPV